MKNQNKTQIYLIITSSFHNVKTIILPIIIIQMIYHALTNCVPEKLHNTQYRLL